MWRARRAGLHKVMLKWEQGDRGWAGRDTPITSSSSELLLIPLDLVKLLFHFFPPSLLVSNLEPEVHSVPVSVEVVEVCLYCSHAGRTSGKLIIDRALP